MTVFATTDIPASINSLEKLAVWTGEVLNYLYPGVSYVENLTQNVRAAQSAPYEVTATDPTQWMYYTRTTVKLNREFKQGATKLWTHAVDIGALSIPTAMKL